MKTPGLMDNLGEFHRALVIHMMYMDAKHADGRLIEDFDIQFRQACRNYLDFLKSMGVDIESSAMPVKSTQNSNSAL